MTHLLARFLVASVGISLAFGQAQPNLRNNSFYNWESPHVHPLDLTPDGTKLLAVNTANNSLEVYDVTGMQTPTLLKNIPVGLDPVSVRARTNTEAWVVNVISDSVSVVNLTAGVVSTTLQTDDEPADVIFAGVGTKQAFVSCAQAKTLLTFSTTSPGAALSRIPILGEQPRALATSRDGRFVYLAIFESGNQTTAVTGGKNDQPFELDIVRDPRGPYKGINVPPNSGSTFVPAINPALPAPPPVSMIVKKTQVGGSYKWLDDNGGDWTAFVSGAFADNGSGGARIAGWDLPDHDVAIVDTSSGNALTYENHLMNIVMAIAVNPATGEATVVGTDATNQIRFEPNLQSTFVRVNFARFLAGGANTTADLNPHLTYTTRSIPVAQRRLSIGDPRGIAWNAAGSTAYVTGMGSNNVVILNQKGARQGLINVGQGPTGIVLQEASSRAFVLNKFDGSISTISLSSKTETARTALYFDPTPANIKAGRPFLYNTQINSGLGQVSCASCHVDARWDRLAWDLGDPTGSMVVNSQNIPFHPMKGPLLSMTLIDTMQAPFFHWRGDRPILENFEGAFQTLLGGDQAAPESSIQALRDFLSTTSLPPNPYRNLDNSYSTNVQIPGVNNTISRVGDANAGAAEFEGGCRSCHPGQTNRGTQFVTNGFGLDQYRNPPTWKNFYKRFGLWFRSPEGSTSGFGFQQDGTFDSTHNGSRSNNMMAFMLSFNGGYPYEPAGLNATNVSNFTHAAVGKQVTLSPTNPTDTSNVLTQLQALADAGAIGLVAKGVVNGQARGYAYLGNQVFQSDRRAEQDAMSHLMALANAGSTITFTAVPAESAIRIGIDMDSDGILDGDDATPAAPNLSQSNLALNGTASQSSTWDSQHAASAAIDGNTLGYFDQNTLSHTAGTETNPWWQVDLGNIYQLSLVQLFNRLDCCSNRLSNVSVFVSMAPFASGNINTTRSQANVQEFFLSGYAGVLPQIPMSALGRYVRVQLNSTTSPSYLQLAEVRVFGAPVTQWVNPGSQSTSVGVPVALPLSFVNSTNAAFAFSATGLPLGLSINPSTGAISGTIQSTAARSNAVTVTAAGSSGTYATSFTWAVSGAPNVLNLSAIANVWGIATLGNAAQNGGFDGAGYAYAASLLGSSSTFNGIAIPFSAANAADAVSSLTIPVTANSYTNLYLLGAAAFGAQQNQAFTVHYTDGSSSTFTQSLSDWMNPQGFARETIVTTMLYRLAGTGQNVFPPNLYGYGFSLNAAKAVSSITLPNNRNVVFLGIALKAK